MSKLSAMGRPHFHPQRCKVCDKHWMEAGSISQKGLCPEHGRERMEENVAQMEARSGPNFTKWRHGMIRCAGGAVLDDLRDTA